MAAPALLGLADQADRRRSARHEVRIEAKIVSLDLWCLVDCTMVDRSEHGAKLELPWPVRLPSQFDLVIPAENLAIPGRSVWRRGKFVGVEFTGPGRPAPKLTP